MYLIDKGNGSVVPVHARIRDHLAARLHADRVDRALAGGASPDATIESALRSWALISNRSRQRLARGMRRAMARANEPWTASSTGVSVNRDQIRLAAPEILELDRLLRTDGPVSVRGVAQIRVLLTTGSGPLYNRRTATNLGPYLRRAIEAMNILDATLV